MKSSVFWTLAILVAGIVAAAVWFVVYVPMFERYNQEKFQISSKKEDIAQIEAKEKEMELLLKLKEAYAHSNQMYEAMMLPKDRQKPEGSNMELFINVLGQKITGSDSIKPVDVTVEASFDSGTYIPYRTARYKIETFMSVIQIGQFLTGLTKSCDVDFLKSLDYQGQSRDEILKPKIILVRTVDVSPPDTNYIEDPQLAKIEEPLQVRIELEYVYFAN